MPAVQTFTQQSLVYAERPIDVSFLPRETAVPEEGA